eukprot:TRINITY_DN31556_c0_g1_i1.p1 TRINITY_DN31556_c0_g1~~TRINITY_DN31556_c0_g1_i1.p1  ORF type:complete len:346 (-),score=93.34 TRINITY_DN31556_c0_g1_i1:171-1208(-)
MHRSLLFRTSRCFPRNSECALITAPARNLAVRFSSSYKEILNKPLILSEIDKVLGKTKPPAIEYLYVNPAYKRWKALLPGYESDVAANPYGHSAIRYTLPSGQQKLMNIVGLPGREMVNFLAPDDYLFGDPHSTAPLGSEQGGVHERGIISVRIEDWPADDVERMDAYYTMLQHRSRRSSNDAGADGSGLMSLPDRASFHMLLGALTNAVRHWRIVRFLFGNLTEKGNCAQWTSKGLVAAGVIPKPYMWPKFLWIKLFMGRILNPTGINVVHYKCVQRQKPKDGGHVALLDMYLYHWFYDLSLFANVVVKVPKDSERAVVKVKNDVFWKSEAFWSSIPDFLKRRG